MLQASTQGDADHSHESSVVITLGELGTICQATIKTPRVISGISGPQKEERCPLEET